MSENKEQEPKEESTEDKVKDAAKDTANAVKDGASLAKNIASQNYIGVVKDALNLLKNKNLIAIKKNLLHMRFQISYVMVLLTLLQICPYPVILLKNIFIIFYSSVSSLILAFSLT